ncbi:sodium-dependent nutrient amino acid transporter 1-like, partial [Gryllus bimaculatus]
MIGVMYIYSYTLFCDDIHFTFGSQPAKIWKMAWLLLPFVQINVLGLFMAEEAWGMRNFLQRKLRHMYNPREETHSQARDTRCKHDCLLDSEILNSIVREEIESTHLKIVPRDGHPFE